jgi:hypothetical protein
VKNALKLAREHLLKSTLFQYEAGQCGGDGRHGQRLNQGRAHESGEADRQHTNRRKHGAYSPVPEGNPIRKRYSKTNQDEADGGVWRHPSGTRI